MKIQDTFVLLNYEDDIPNDGWNDFNRQCRGVILDLEEKRVLAHPFDTFFNLDSHPETERANLPYESGYEIVTKYDGTMVTLFDNAGELKFAIGYDFDNAHVQMAMGIAERRYPELQKIDIGKYTGEQKSIEEGWIVRFGNSFYVKVKTWQYLATLYIQKIGFKSRQLAIRYYAGTPQDWNFF